MQNNRAWENSKPINPIIAIDHKSKKVLLFYTKARAGRYLKEIGLSNAKHPESSLQKYLTNEKYKGNLVYGFEWLYAAELINDTFSCQSLSTCGQNVHYLVKSNKDKIAALFKPYFVYNKDDIVDLSSYYDEISKRLMSAKLLLNNAITHLMEVETNENP